jgi:CheY-like chemotaxis protein
MPGVSKLAARRKTAPPDRQRTGKYPILRSDGLPPLVLLVDDHEDTREMYSTYFIDAGFQVAHAVDGDHALFKILATPPDVVIMDLAMPLLDGWAATRAIKAHPRIQHIPVVVLTGQVTPESLERARVAGAEAVLTKPCLPPELCFLVKTILDR